MLLLGSCPGCWEVSWLLGGRKSPPGGQEALSLSLAWAWGREGREGATCIQEFPLLQDESWETFLSLCRPDVEPLVLTAADPSVLEGSTCGCGASEVCGVGVVAVTSLFVFHLQPPEVA